ncbi:DUF1198 family protein [Pantoea phytobeneficialis]|uniref:DUF1198 family protein n=1 Tax=Pantoea phytobeneficialis TaxID=2052056 RepID=A0AAP9H8F3_9GAMM|nr:DUF1198 family protein [Pantoea phytobeneficialis]MDO6407230.1 DUF1198 family protein [Pantoea phytobeneficialis]QGR08675.1 hypothetical protein CTZ24_05225 [Pantoea phytobeneficialis]
MIWLILATLVVVFVVGFRLLTAGSRHAAQSLSKRLQLPPVHVESMLSLMGKEAAKEFTDYITGDNENHLQNAAAVLLIWQVCIVDGEEENMRRWHQILSRAHFSPVITQQQLLLAMGFLRELEPDREEMNLMRERFNGAFLPGVELEGKADEESNLVSLSDYRKRH